MNLKEIILFIDGKITEKYRNRSNYCRENNKVKQTVNSLITGILYENKDCKVGTVISILDDLGYEITVKKKEPTIK